MDPNELRVLVHKDCDVWTAQCLEYDIGAQAPDLDTLKRRLDLTLRVELNQSLARTGRPFGGIEPAPDHVFAAFEETDATLRASSKTTSTPKSAPSSVPKTAPIEYEMALCA